MRAMVMEKQGEKLKLKHVEVPVPNADEVLIKIDTCGVCRTDLHIVDGELENPKLPLIPGHEIIGTIEKKGSNVDGFQTGDRVGVPWLGFTCGHCKYCKKGKENLCENAKFTGYTIDGGFAEYTTANYKYCFSIDRNMDKAEAAPLMCAGLIGYRSYRLAGDDIKTLGIYGFGAAAHILTQLAVWQDKKIYAFTKPGDKVGQEFAKELGAVWAGNSEELPPAVLDAAIIFAPAGPLVVEALKAVDKGGVVVCGGIHMSDIPSFPYKYLWEERQIKSVANLERLDGEEFLKLAPQVPVKTHVHRYPLEKANEALDDLRAGKFTGAAVLVM